MKKVLPVLFSLFFLLQANANVAPAFFPEASELISEERVKLGIENLAKKLQKEFTEKKISEITFVVLMKGGICFAADLMRCLDIPLHLETIQTKSYGMNGKIAGQLQIFGLDELDLTGKDVLVVDDIFDTGKTLHKVMEEIEKKKPKSLYSVVLLDKVACHKTSYKPDYTVFEIDNHFVVGYGMDFKELGRNIPGVWSLD